jgi:hypothetical protein
MCVHAHGCMCSHVHGLSLSLLSLIFISSNIFGILCSFILFTHPNYLNLLLPPSHLIFPVGPDMGSFSLLIPWFCLVNPHGLIHLLLPYKPSTPKLRQFSPKEEEVCYSETLAYNQNTAHCNNP